jgi:hypothetical protein
MNLTFVTSVTLLTCKQVFPANFHFSPAYASSWLTPHPGLRLIPANWAHINNPLVSWATNMKYFCTNSWKANIEPVYLHLVWYCIRDLGILLTEGHKHLKPLDTDLMLIWIYFLDCIEHSQFIILVIPEVISCKYMKFNSDVHHGAFHVNCTFVQ